MPSLTQMAVQPFQQPAREKISQMMGIPMLVLGGTDEEANKLIVWNADPKRKTEFAPAVVERISRANAMKTSAIRLIDVMQCTAQPNKHFRGEQLVPSDVNTLSERIEFARSLGDFGSCFDNMEPLLQYTREIVDLEMQTDRHQEVFLRQVMLFCMRPLKMYIDVFHPEITKAYNELKKMRDKYDSGRKKKDVTKMQDAYIEMMANLRLFAGLIDQQPSHQMTFANALDMFARAEATFGEMVYKMSAAVRGLKPVNN